MTIDQKIQALVIVRCEAIVSRDYNEVRRLDNEIRALREKQAADPHEQELLALVQALWPGALIMPSVL